MTLRRLALASSWLAVCAGALARREAAQQPVAFAREVQPILAENCLACHGADPDGRKAGLRLDTRSGMLADLGGYAAVVPGKPEESELLRRVTAPDDDERMPPAEHGERLSGSAIEVLRRWIAEGARWQGHWAYQPLRAVEVPAEVPGLAPADPPGHPIDAFVRARLRRTGLQPSPPAPAHVLLRRLALDLTGLPPTPAELREFVSGRTTYEELVDRYLASPAFAVHWARHWLDLARYADSHGFTIDGERSIWPWRDWVVAAIDADMPFDRFTVEQIAGDLLPHATRAQRVATGFHRNTQVNQEGGAKDEENRVNAVIDRVNTTGAVWLGTTIGCAQCHTHKFDPVSHDEYYRLFAFFDQTVDGGVSAEPSMLVPRNDDEEAAAAAWESEFERLQAGYDDARDRAAAGFATWQPARAWGSNGPELRPEEDGSYRVLGQNAVYSTYVLQGRGGGDGFAALRLEALPASGLSAGGPGRARNGNFVLQHARLFVRPWREGAADAEPDLPWRRLPFAQARADVQQDGSASGGKSYPVATAAGTEPGAGWAIAPAFDTPHVAEFTLEQAVDAGDWELRLELQQEHGSSHCLGAFRVALGHAPADDTLVPDAWSAAWRALRVHRGRKPRMPTTLVMQARQHPRTTRVFHRGSFLDPRHEVRPGFPANLDCVATDAEPADRLDLARWLAHRDNALVQRVTVNRWWQQLFGVGIVATENDFGLRGAPPTHPDLLEWLVAEFRRVRFSRKALLRRIVTSATYRQDDTVDSAQRDRDPGNRWLGRQRRLRLSGEVLRDAALAISSLLETRMGGPPVQPPQPDGVFSFTQSKKTWQASTPPDRFRRSLYTRIWRSSPYPFQAVFDTPQANVTCTRRSVSNTPLQALTMANDPMLLELAEGFAGRLLREVQGDDRARLDRAFLLALGREPRAAEVDLVLGHLARVTAAHDPQHGWTAVARLIFNLDEFLNRP
ncbi:MAG: PSD1 and planctomycete cytochrome C domain-containing protein [Planctomycetota bacterium]